MLDTLDSTTQESFNRESINLKIENGNFEKNEKFNSIMISLGKIKALQSSNSNFDLESTPSKKDIDPAKDYLQIVKNYSGNFIIP